MSFTLRKLFAAAFGTLALAAGNAAVAADRLVIAATPVPHAEILEFVKPMLAKEGVELEVKVSVPLIGERNSPTAASITAVLSGRRARCSGARLGMATMREPESLWKWGTMWSAMAICRAFVLRGGQ